MEFLRNSVDLTSEFVFKKYKPVSLNIIPPNSGMNFFFPCILLFGELLLLGGGGLWIFPCYGEYFSVNYYVVWTSGMTIQVIRESGVHVAVQVQNAIASYAELSQYNKLNFTLEEKQKHSSLTEEIAYDVFISSIQEIGNYVKSIKILYKLYKI